MEIPANANLVVNAKSHVKEILNTPRPDLALGGPIRLHFKSIMQKISNKSRDRRVFFPVKVKPCLENWLWT